MERLRQRHADKSQSVLELRNRKWQIHLMIVRVDGSFASFVANRADDSLLLEFRLS